MRCVFLRFNLTVNNWFLLSHTRSSPQGRRELKTLADPLSRIKDGFGREIPFLPPLSPPPPLLFLFSTFGETSDLSFFLSLRETTSFVRVIYGDISYLTFIACISAPDPLQGTEATSADIQRNPDLLRDPGMRFL